MDIQEPKLESNQGSFRLVIMILGGILIIGLLAAVIALAVLYSNQKNQQTGTTESKQIP